MNQSPPASCPRCGRLLWQFLSPDVVVMRCGNGCGKIIPHELHMVVEDPEEKPSWWGDTFGGFGSVKW